MTPPPRNTGSASSSRFTTRRVGRSACSLFTGVMTDVRGHAPQAEEEPATEEINLCRRSHSSVSRRRSDSGGWRLLLVYFLAAHFLAPSAQTQCWCSGSSLSPELRPELHILPHMVAFGSRIMLTNGEK